MQDETAKIENRLEELKNRKVYNNNDEDDKNNNCGSGGGGSGSDDGTPPRLPRDQYDDFTRPLNILRENLPDDDIDAQDISNNRLNRLRYGPINETQEEKIEAKRLRERENEIVKYQEESLNLEN